MPEDLCVETYLNAVALRRPTKKLRHTEFVNMAILQTLEGKDVPRLIEMVRVQYKAISDSLSKIEQAAEHNAVTDETAVEIATIIAQAATQTEELALQGDSTRWGEYTPKALHEGDRIN